MPVRRARLPELSAPRHTTLSTTAPRPPCHRSEPELYQQGAYHRPREGVPAVHWHGNDHHERLPHCKIHPGRPDGPLRAHHQRVSRVPARSPQLLPPPGASPRLPVPHAPRPLGGRPPVPRRVPRAMYVHSPLCTGRVRAPCTQYGSWYTVSTELPSFRRALSTLYFFTRNSAPDYPKERDPHVCPLFITLPIMVSAALTPHAPGRCSAIGGPAACGFNY